MSHEIRVQGDELVFIREPLAARWFPAGLWFAVAGGVFLISLLPLGAERRDPYPWGACSVVWLLSGASGFAGLVVLKTSKGISFDRKKGTVVEWRERFGRRTERRHPLGAFDRLQIRTWLSRHSRTRVISRWYDLELRGPRETVSLSSGVVFNREASDQLASELTGFLKLPTVLIDQNPGDRL